MANLIVNQGLQIIGDRAANIGGPPAAIQAMGVDDATGAGNSFLAAHTKLNDRAGATQVSAKAMDATFPSRSGQVVTFQSTWGTGDANFTIGRISLHNVAFGSVTISSTNLVGGIDQQSLTKTSDFSLTISAKITFTSA